MRGGLGPPPPEALFPSAPIASRPGTAGSNNPMLSDQNGSGEVSMMDFVQKYMMNILQPYTDSMGDLRASVSRISSDVVESLDQLDQHAKSIRSQEECLRGTENTFKPLQDRLAAVERDVAMGSAQRQTQAMDQKETQAKVAKVESRQTAAEERQEQFEQGFRELEVMVGKVSEAQAELKRLMADEVRPLVEATAAEVSSLEASHQRVVGSLNEARIVVNASAEDLKLLRLKFEAECASNQGCLSDLETRIRKQGELVMDNQRLLKARLDHSQANDKATEALMRRVDGQISAHNMEKERQDKADAMHVAHDARETALERSVEQLLVFMRKLSGKRDVSEAVDELVAEVAQTGEEVRRLKQDLGETRKHGKQTGEKIEDFSSEIEALVKRALRIEKSVGLSKPPKKGVKAEKSFKEVFAKFDLDGNGSINCAELTAVMEMLGMRPSDSVVRQMIGWVDSDGDGEIGYPEFCALMEDMVGPDGKPDPEKMTPEYALENLSVMARERNNVFTIMEHTADIHANKEGLQHLKDLDIDHNLKRLQSDFATMARQIDKLRQGVDLNQEYWKGMTKGLKETQLSAKAEGQRLQRTNTLHLDRPRLQSNETMPAATPLATPRLAATTPAAPTLPAISQRPPSKGNMTVR